LIIGANSLDDLRYGKRDKRGDWSPNEPPRTSPLFAFPSHPLALLKLLPGYFLPWNVLFLLSALALWTWLLPSIETMKTLTPIWILYLLALNAVAVILFYGAFELRLYVPPKQGARFKFNAKLPVDNKKRSHS
jgi:hypothetical protein